MNIIQFKYAIEVERTGSISQAAENLYMAQPNLSKAIRELEGNARLSRVRAHIARRGANAPGRGIPQTGARRAFAGGADGGHPRR